MPCHALTFNPDHLMGAGQICMPSYQGGHCGGKRRAPKPLCLAGKGAAANAVWNIRGYKAAGHCARCSIPKTRAMRNLR